ncbi:MAG: metal-dependent transcriptional regulator [Firmicutes bacterium]|nr:metal-dependent transcriptional regulator [Bacillota bacterium]
MSMQESGEMYLETIYILSQKHSSVRSIDVAEAMGYSKPSVSRALGLLKKNGYAETDTAGNITLTKEGKKIAKDIYERHTVLSTMFRRLGVDEKTAVEDACRVEHYISDKTFKAIKKHLKDYPEEK